jgi:hypothetical protein
VGQEDRRRYGRVDQAPARTSRSVCQVVASGLATFKPERHDGFCSRHCCTGGSIETLLPPKEAARKDEKFRRAGMHRRVMRLKHPASGRGRSVRAGRGWRRCGQLKDLNGTCAEDGNALP